MRCLTSVRGSAIPVPRKILIPGSILSSTSLGDTIFCFHIISCPSLLGMFSETAVLRFFFLLRPQSVFRTRRYKDLALPSVMMVAPHTDNGWGQPTGIHLLNINQTFPCPAGTSNRGKVDT